MVSPDRRSYPGTGVELPDVYGSRVGIDHNILEAHQPRTLRAPARYIQHIDRILTIVTLYPTLLYLGITATSPSTKYCDFVLWIGVLVLG
jgi:hypothetical protein